MGPKFTLGWMAEALYSSKNFSENYTATMMQAGEFAPTPDQRGCPRADICVVRRERHPEDHPGQGQRQSPEPH